jgi:hypothetical protein
MTAEVWRVDPGSSAPVGVPWSGFGLKSEARHPVSGTGYQLWSIARTTQSPSSAILEGMPVSPAFATVDEFVEWLRAPQQRDRAGCDDLSLSEAYIFADLLQVAENSTTVDGRNVRGIRGAVAGFRYWRDALRANGRV